VPPAPVPAPPEFSQARWTPMPAPEPALPVEPIYVEPPGPAAVPGPAPQPFLFQEPTDLEEVSQAPETFLEEEYRQSAPPPALAPVYGPPLFGDQSGSFTQRSGRTVRLGTPVAPPAPPQAPPDAPYPASPELPPVDNRDWGDRSSRYAPGQDAAPEFPAAQLLPPFEADRRPEATMPAMPGPAAADESRPTTPGPEVATAGSAPAPRAAGQKKRAPSHARPRRKPSTTLQPLARALMVATVILIVGVAAVVLWWNLRKTATSGQEAPSHQTDQPVPIPQPEPPPPVPPAPPVPPPVALPVLVDAFPYALVTIQGQNPEFKREEMTPFRMPLPPGTYTFTFQCELFKRTYVQTLTVPPGGAVMLPVIHKFREPAAIADEVLKKYKR